MTITRADPTTRDEVLVALREGERFVLVTHENPDGDALGSLVAMQGVLRALEKDSVMFIAHEEFPLPYEYAFFAFDGLVSDIPLDVAGRTIVFLDCGNFDRNAVEVGDATIVNVDHHHDNTHFGTINHVDVGASCTAEIVWDLMRGLDVALTPQIAEALYVGLVTDTGRFMYENTGPRAHMMAADLIEAGVDVHEIYRRLYEGVPEPKLALLTRALAQVQRFDGGRLTMARLTREDFEQTGAEESYTEGIIDHLRAVQGTKVAALARELTGVDRRGAAKVSLRATDGEIDVSLIARLQGGGGHRQAAGFATEMHPAELVTFLRQAMSAQLDADRMSSSNEEVSTVEASDADTSAEAVKAVPGKCKEWKAAYMEGTLMVRGWCTFPSSGWSMELRHAEPQGINPKDLLLERVVALQAGIQADVLRVIEVEYDEKTDVEYDTVTILPDGPTVEVQRPG